MNVPPAIVRTGALVLAQPLDKSVIVRAQDFVDPIAQNLSLGFLGQLPPLILLHIGVSPDQLPKMIQEMVIISLLTILLTWSLFLGPAVQEIKLSNSLQPIIILPCKCPRQ